MSMLLASVSFVSNGFNELDAPTRSTLVSLLTDAVNMKDTLVQQPAIASALATACSVSKAALLFPPDFALFRTVENLVARIADHVSSLDQPFLLMSSCYYLETRMVSEPTAARTTLSPLTFLISRPPSSNTSSLLPFYSVSFLGGEIIPALAPASAADSPATNRFVLLSVLGREVKRCLGRVWNVEFVLEALQKTQSEDDALLALIVPFQFSLLGPTAFKFLYFVLQW